MRFWQRLWRRKQMEEQLDNELRFHVEQHAADLIARGYPSDEARRLARLELGGPEQVKEQCRDARGTLWLENFWHDLRYAFRTLRQRPGFAATALAMLALGAGGATVMFTLIDGVLFTPLPYRDPARLVALHGHTDTWNIALFRPQNLAYYDFLDIQRECHSLALAGFLYNSSTLTAPGDPEYVDHIEISSNLFSVLGVPLFAGREFSPEEDRAGATPVAILGYSFWRRRFAGSMAAIGSRLVIDEKDYTVVGVAARTFRAGGDEADVYTPIGQNTLGYMRRRAAHPVGAVARLRPGATLAQARAELGIIARNLAQKYPDSNKGRTFVAEALRPDVGNVRSTLWLLLAAVTLVLLIACANIASLLLARAVSRERELAMRAALGASRGRLIRQCLTESSLLGVCGGALGIVIAAIAIRPFVLFWPGELPRAEDVRLNWHVFAFALAISLFSGLLFGLAPALRVQVCDVERALRAGARAIVGRSRRMHAAFVISEVALAVVLLVCAGMLGRTLLRLASTDPGLNVKNVLTARVALGASTLANPDRTRAAWADILDSARRVPGVKAAAIVDTIPMRAGNNPIGYRTSAAAVPENRQPLVLATCVTPDYLTVMGITMREGRFFTDQDRLGKQPVVVIDELMAQQAFPGQDPIGKHLWIDLGGDPVTVVGVVGYVRYWGPAGDDKAAVRAQLYYPLAQVPDNLLRRWSELMSVTARTSVEPLSILEPLRRAVRGAGRDQVLYEVRTMEQLARESIARQRFLVLLFGIFASIALLLASIGIYGVLAYLTSRRVPEIGVRMALGASADEVVRLVLRDSIAMIFAGVAVGTAAAWAAGQYLARSVDGVRSMEPLTSALMIAILVSAALLASYAPARRASRLDPVRALRVE